MSALCAFALLSFYGSITYTYFIEYFLLYAKVNMKSWTGVEMPYQFATFTNVVDAAVAILTSYLVKRTQIQFKMLLWLPLLVSALSYTKEQELSFLTWCRTYNKYYVGVEFILRFSLWIRAANYIHEFNEDQTKSYKLELNQFAAMTDSEYRRALLDITSLDFTTRQRFAVSDDIKSNDDVPAALDWRDKGVVGPVKDQGQCGASWAFSAIAAVESEYSIAHGSLLDLSEQNLIDCVLVCSGCTSGQPDCAYVYVLLGQLGYFMTESDYPYSQSQDKCKFDLRKAYASGVKMTVTHYADQDEKDMKEKCATRGVLTAFVDASGKDFEFYHSGIYDNPKCDWMHPNLAVAIVGYGAEGGHDYWIVRNAFGALWGESGYIRMSRNKNGQCGIDLLVCYPVFD